VLRDRGVLVLRSIVTLERCKALSDLIGSEWTLLAKKMGFNDERISELGKQVEAVSQVIA